MEMTSRLSLNWMPPLFRELIAWFQGKKKKKKVVGLTRFLPSIMPVSKAEKNQTLASIILQLKFEECSQINKRCIKHDTAAVTG